MKTILSSIIISCLTLTFYSQEFDWSSQIEVFNSNEVAGMDTDNSGNIYLTGVMGADVFVPYNGEAYVTKVNDAGTEEWNVTLGIDLIIADLVCSEDKIYIAGHSTDDISYNGELVSEATSESFLTVLILSLDGEYIASLQYPTYFGQYAHLDYHDGTIVLQCSGEFNLGDYVFYIEDDGSSIFIQPITSDNFSINEIAYYNGWTYLTGGTSFGQGIEIDNVSIPGPENESLNILLAFDEEFVAQWGHAVNTINSQGNQVVADQTGVYSYQTVLEENFNFSSEIWRFDLNGENFNSINPPVFSNSIALNPNLTLSNCHLAMASKNSFQSDSHEVIIFNHDLSLVDEKFMDGASANQSPAICSFQNEIYAANIFNGQINLNDELTVTNTLTNAAFTPYLAKITSDEDCDSNPECLFSNASFEFDECDNGVFGVIVSIDQSNVSEFMNVEVNGVNWGEFETGEESYYVGPFLGDGMSNHEVFFIDDNDPQCFDSVSFTALDCQTNGLLEMNREIKIYPNPAENILTLQGEGLFLNPEIKIYNMIGKLVLQEKINSRNLDVSSLEPGNYYLILDTGKGELLRKNFIKL